MSRERTHKLARDKAEADVAALKLSADWSAPTDAGNGRIRLNHTTGVTVEGNRASEYAVVIGDKVVGYGYSLKAAVDAVEAVAPKPEPVVETPVKPALTVSNVVHPAMPVLANKTPVKPEKPKKKRKG